jgi:AcrR family transcriptional regulator
MLFSCKEKVSRKDQILEAAFYLMQVNDRWSLAEAAAHIGVSKTAIYRHFKNRAEIEDAMNEVLRRDLLAVIEGAEFSPDKIRFAVTSFFRAHPGHLFLLMHNSSASPEYDNELFSFLEKESPRLASFSAHMNAQTPAKKNELQMDILKNTVSIFIASVNVPGIAPLQNELITILGKGLPNLAIPQEGRLDELEKAIREVPIKCENNSKMFDAIAATIKEFGIPHTTVERIAEKMGTAKSSLYFYFKNKNEMLGELIKKETETIIDLCASRAALGNTFAEQLYIIMQVQAEYLLLKPEILAVFSWIRYETVRSHPSTPPKHVDVDELIRPYHTEEILPADGSTPSCDGQKKRGVAMIKWASIVSTSLIIQGLKRGAGGETMKKNIRVMFMSMMNGDGLNRERLVELPKEHVIG